MKFKSIISMALLMILGAWKQTIAQTIVSGKLPDLKNESIILIPVDDYFPGLKPRGDYQIVKTDSGGGFKINLIAKKSNFYQIISNNYHHLKFDVFIEPGDSIYIDQSSWNEDPKFIITGKGSEKYKYLEKDFSFFPKDPSFYEKIRSNVFPTELDFKSFIDSIHFERVNILNSFETIPDLVREYHLNTLNAERADFLLEHLERRNYYLKDSFYYFFPEISYYNFLNHIDFNNNFSKTTAAKMLARTYLNDKAQHALKTKNDEERWNESLNWKFNYISNQPKSYWTDLLTLSTISEYSFGLMIDDFFENLKTFEQIMKGRFTIETYRSLFDFNISGYKKLAPGMPAPDFELPDSNGTLHRLSDFKDRIVYIDFWGTWCYPCIAEIPDALLLQEKYKDKPITFLYVALEYDSSDIEGWKEFISGKNSQFGKFLDYKPFPGTHLVAKNQFRNESISGYKLSFAPTHVLIDKKGNIVKARAKRSKDIHNEIDKLLTEHVVK